jgi:four helix bundle protein
MEVVSQSQVARRQSFMTEQDMESLYNEADELARMLSGFKSKLKT